MFLWIPVPNLGEADDGVCNAGADIGAPAATSPTMMEVEVEEDCTSTVTRTPIITPTIGFPSRSELEKKAEGDSNLIYSFNIIHFIHLRLNSLLLN